MSIYVEVKNNDSRPNAVIVVRTQTHEGNLVSGAKDVELTGKQEQEFMVHSTQRLLIEEVRNG